MNKKIILLIILAIITLIGIFIFYQYQKEKLQKKPTISANSIDDQVSLVVKNNNSEFYPNFTVDSKSHLVDLNNDGRLDLLLYVVGPQACGTGGCGLYIYRNLGDKFELINSVSVVQGVYLADTYTNSYRDLVIAIGGGGGKSASIKIQYNGKNYPDNASVNGDFIIEIKSIIGLEKIF